MPRDCDVIQSILSVSINCGQDKRDVWGRRHARVGGDETLFIVILCCIQQMLNCTVDDFSVSFQSFGCSARASRVMMAGVYRLTMMMA